MIINIEWGDFTAASLPVLEVDRAIDRASVNPGVQPRATQITPASLDAACGAHATQITSPLLPCVTRVSVHSQFAAAKFSQRQPIIFVPVIATLHAYYRSEWSPPPPLPAGEQIFEKLLSGMYLGQIAKGVRLGNAGTRGFPLPASRLSSHSPADLPLLTTLCMSRLRARRRALPTRCCVTPKVTAPG